MVTRVPFAEYLAIDAVNWSTLKYLRVSPLHYRHALAIEKSPTAAMRRGTAMHVAVLEPDELANRYAVIADEEMDALAPKRNTREGKQRWAEWLEQHPDDAGLGSDDYRRRVLSVRYPGVEIITEAAYAEALAMRDAVRSHPIAGPLLDRGVAEQTVRWIDEATGLACKGRLDWRRSAHKVIDLKSARSLDAHRFAGQAWALGYFHQMALYRAGVAADLGWPSDSVDVQIIAVESAPPYDVAVKEPDEDSLDLAGKEVATLLARLVVCRETNEWPGAHADGVEVLRAPVHVLDDDYEFTATEQAA